MEKFVKIDKARIVITYFEREKAETWYTDKKRLKFSSFIRKFREIGCKVIYD
jgi:hypothetical protein